MYKSGPLSSPKRARPRSSPSPKPRRIGAAIPAMNCDIRWASPTRKRIISSLRAAGISNWESKHVWALHQPADVARNCRAIPVGRASDT
jgi:hypothetical protein